MFLGNKSMKGGRRGLGVNDVERGGDVTTKRVTRMRVTFFIFHET